MSNIARALKQLYLGGRAPLPPHDRSPGEGASADAYAQVSRTMIEEIRADVADIRVVQRWTFALIATTVIAEVVRSLMMR